MKPTLRGFLFWSLITIVLAYLVLPAVVVVVASFGNSDIVTFPPQSYSLRWYVRAINYPDFQRAFYSSLIVMLVSSTLATVLGAAFAYLIFRYKFRGQGVLEGILWSPLIIPHFTVGFGFLLLGSQLDLMQSYLIVVLAHVVLVLPFITRAVFVSLCGTDPNFARAAANLGASPSAVLLKITLPLALPGMVGGWLIAAVLSLTEFTASLYVTGSRNQTLPVAMYSYIREYVDPSIACVSALMIALTTLIMIAINYFLDLRRVFGIGNQ